MARVGEKISRPDSTVVRSNVEKSRAGGKLAAAQRL
jgi:hypothetical protein